MGFSLKKTVKKASKAVKKVAKVVNPAQAVGSSKLAKGLKPIAAGVVTGGASVGTGFLGSSGGLGGFLEDATDTINKAGKFAAGLKSAISGTQTATLPDYGAEPAPAGETATPSMSPWLLIGAAAVLLLILSKRK